jgi:hypothetical protein
MAPFVEESAVEESAVEASLAAHAKRAPTNLVAPEPGMYLIVWA